MRSATSIWIGILVASLVFLVDSGIEAYSDAAIDSPAGMPLLFKIVDAALPISGLLTGILAATVWWYGSQTDSVSSNTITILLCFLGTMAVLSGVGVIRREFLYMNGSRETPWYRYMFSLALFAGLAIAAFLSKQRQRKTEQEGADRPPTGA